MDREPIPPQPVDYPPKQAMIPGMHVQGGAMTVNVAVIDAKEGKALVLRIEAANGSFMFPMDPDTAIKIGSALREHGRNAKSGIIVPDALPGMNGLA
jgi:hypothetical protein